MFNLKKITFVLLTSALILSTMSPALATSNEVRFRSNRFTQVEEDDRKLVNDNNSLEGFILAASNDYLSLYVETSSLAIKLRNEVTGYIWSSTLDQMEDHQLNETWRNFVRSAMTIDFTLMGENPSRESLTLNQSQVDFGLMDDGFYADIEFGSSGIKMQLQVRIEDADLVVTVLDESIYEPEGVQLMAVQLYPFFGATKEDHVPGYLFIPDGAGALIRFGEQPIAMDSPFRTMIYGQDDGINPMSASLLNAPHVTRMPVYGMVHGVRQNAFLTIIEKGDHYAELIAHTAGLFTEFNWITATFHFRQTYFQPTTRDVTRGPTILMLQDTRNHFDIEMRHRILSEDQADYVGMALSYQARLVEKGVLTPLSNVAPMMRLEFFGGEMRSGLLWDTVVAMTPITDILGHVERLREQGLSELLVTYVGWARGGFSNSFPNRGTFERRLGRRGEVNDVVETLAEQGIPMYFQTDYLLIQRGRTRLFDRPTFAQKINGNPMYALNPVDALEQARTDVNRFAGYGMENLAISNTASYLHSTWGDGFTATRSENAEHIQELFQVLNEGNSSRTALYEPNATFWNQTQHFFDIPMTASGYLFATDTVPFMHIVLRGHITYYAPVSNFSANSRQELLRMIDFGAYPSFLLTSRPSHLLADTPSSQIFTSEFEMWESTVFEYYQVIVAALGHVRGASIVARDILVPGVVKVAYSNGIQIVVNYTADEVRASGVMVEAESFRVIQGGR